MSTFGMANIPDNRSLMATVGSRIRADARMLAATATFWRLLGFGSFLLLTGIGVGIGSFGYSYITDQRATMDKLTTAITDALNKVTLKTDGTVKLTDGTVKLDTKGASVRLDTAVLMRPNTQQLDPRAQPLSKANVVTDYTVFKTVEFDTGSVVTGWNYASNEDSTPTYQFCYYSVLSSEHTSTRYDFAKDGVMLPAPLGLPVNLEQAFANCVWFGNAARRGRTY